MKLRWALVNMVVSESSEQLMLHGSIRQPSSEVQETNLDGRHHAQVKFVHQFII